MKKVLIISYFFPPCSLTASERVFSWAKWLNKFGYYPVIVTRKWENRLKALKDVSIPTTPGVEHVKKQEYEVYYLPYNGNLRDILYSKYGADKFKFIRHGLTFLELFFQYFYNKAIPYHNIYGFSRKLLKKHKFDFLLISGNPFNLFKFGYQLNKEFNIKWLADYRDAWSTSEINDNSSSLFRKIIHKLDTHYEKKWVSTAFAVTASSGPIGDSITKLTGTKSFPLYNGIAFEDFEDIPTENLDKFTIAYIGTLYDGQKIEVFCNAFKKFIDQTPNVKTILLFPGLAFFGDQETRVKKALAGYENYFKCSERIPRADILKLEKNAHLLLHVAWQGFNGIIASKIYEYIASGTKILVCPSDSGAIEGIINSSKCGTCCSNEEEIIAVLNSNYHNFINGNTLKNNINTPEVQQFSREKQVERLVKLALIG